MKYVRIYSGPMRINLSFLLVLSLFFNCVNSPKEPEPITLIPKVKSLTVNDGVYELNQNIKINSLELFDDVVSYLESYLKSSNFLVSKTTNSSDIIFKQDTSITNEEGYVLDVNQNGVIIKASTIKGAFYAVQTLRQLLPNALENGSYKAKQLALSYLHIEDAPVFSYRGMHLDVSRHMFPVAFIKKQLDAMALLKLNTFHWHLTDDQGWRIEIKKYPKLTSVGSQRKQTLVGHKRNKPEVYDGKPYGGFYTQEDIKEIVAYAEARQITIIPEIEMPGHSMAAITAYPELSCSEGPFKVREKWGVEKHIFCPTETTFKFLEDVLDEVISLFPSVYIHIGGDEAPKEEWENSVFCQALIKSKGLKDTHELQSYFISRMEAYLNSKGRQIIGWDEILEGGLASNATVMSWRGFNGAIEAAKIGNPAVVAPNQFCYLDHYQSRSTSEPLAIGGFLPLKKVYMFNPIPEQLTKAQSQLIKGAQACVWTEYMPESSHVEYMVYPRLLALSEVVWLNEKDRDFKDFQSRVDSFFQRLEVMEFNHANHLYKVEGQVNFKEKMTISLNNFSDFPVHYTTDGTPPNEESKVYTKPVAVNGDMHLKAASFNASGKIKDSEYEETVTLSKAFGAKVEIAPKPNKKYKGSGYKSLVDGILGDSERFKDKQWLGFQGTDVFVDLQLNKPKELQVFKTRFNNAKGNWIYAPRSVRVEVYSADHKLLFNKSKIIQPSDERHVNFKMALNGITGQFVKVYIEGFGIMPDKKLINSQVIKGAKTWTFLDEFILE